MAVRRYKNAVERQAANSGAARRTVGAHGIRLLTILERGLEK